MLKNYIKIAVRGFWRDKTFSVINLFGLAIGLAAVMIIMAYVRYEFSYDKHYSNAENVYRIQGRMGQEQELFSIIQSGTGLMLSKEFPEISAYTYGFKETNQFKNKDGLLELTTISGSADFFKVFDLPFIAGDKLTALSEPNTIVLTKNTADKFFPGQNAVGKIMTVNWGRQYKVTAIINTIPGNTHFQGDAITSVEGSFIARERATFKDGGMILPQYVLLKPGTDVDALVNKFKGFYKKYEVDPQTTFELLNVKNIHLYSHTYNELQPGGDIKYIYIFSLAGLLILVIAVINYINLATARSVKRTQEIGIRKVLGAEKKQLIFQFLAESFMFFAVALVVAAILAQALWPYFEQRIANGTHIIGLFSTTSVYVMVGVTICGGLLAGMFPAFFLAKVKPALSLKGIINYNVNVSFRKALVVFQFVISGILVIATLVVQKQLHFISDSKLGFNKEQLIVLPFSEGWHHNIGAFKQELRKNAAIKGISVTSIDVGTNFQDLSKMFANPDKKADTIQQVGLQFLDGDTELLKTFQIPMVEGRDFSELYSNDNLVVDTLTMDFKNPHKNDNVYARKSVILNESAVKQLGLKNPVGQQLVYKDRPHGTIVGVVKDFNIASMYQKVPGMVIISAPKKGTGQLYIRIGPQHISQTLGFIGDKWKRFYPDEMFKFSFVDDKLQKLYVSEQTLGSLFGVFAFIAIMIACLGLFGLVYLTVEQRVREIGIRKVLGATVSNIVAILSGDLLKLVIIAILIASPIAWWAMSKWLQNFAYSIDIPWWIFAITAAMAVITAFLTLSYHTLKAAMANPVKSLRSE